MNTTVREGEKLIYTLTAEKKTAKLKEQNKKGQVSVSNLVQAAMFRVMRDDKDLKAVLRELRTRAKDGDDEAKMALTHWEARKKETDLAWFID